MEFEKITSLLDTTSNNKDLPKFVTKKWIEVYDQSEKHYSPNKEIGIKTTMHSQVYATILMRILL